MEEKKNKWPFSGVSVREVPTKAGEHEDWKSPRFIPRVACLGVPKNPAKGRAAPLLDLPFPSGQCLGLVSPRFSPLVLALRVWLATGELQRAHRPQELDQRPEITGLT